MNFIYSSPQKTSKEKKISFENSKEKMLKGKFNNDIQQERDNDNFGNEISEFCIDDIEQENSSEKTAPDSATSWLCASLRILSCSAAKPFSGS